MLANDVLHTIGNTPHIRINRLFGTSHNVYVKSERSNPGGSIKDRIALSMIEAAEAARRAQAGRDDRRADLGQHRRRPGDGGRGQGLQADPGDARQHERRAAPADARLRRDLRADAAREGHERRHRPRRRSWWRATPGAWMPQQFENPANIDVHVRTTAQEIAADFPSGIDALITGVGTGGHITGCAQVLKKMWPKLKVCAVEPSASPVISGGKPSPHPIQGIGAGFIPKNLHVELLDGVIQVEAEAAREMARRCGARGGHAGRHLVGRGAGGDRPEAARASPPARRCSASTTTPASATSRSKAFCSRRE